MLKKEAALPRKYREPMVEFLSSIAAVLATGLFIITFVVQAFAIPSPSMENTLLVGDHVFVNRLQFSPASRWLGSLLPYRDIRRGDIVVFLHPAQPGIYVVKRIIGIPGDHIHLHHGTVYRNGEKLDEPYVIHQPNGGYIPYRDDFPTGSPSEFTNAIPSWQLTLPRNIQGNDLVVPPNRYFGMVDNRDVSYDSRFWGFIPKKNVIGYPMFIYWSFVTPNGQYLKKDFGDQIQFLTHAVVHFFDETRWRRTFKVVQ
jgi:signal peptidase I